MNEELVICEIKMDKADKETSLVGELELLHKPN